MQPHVALMEFPALLDRPPGSCPKDSVPSQQAQPRHPNASLALTDIQPRSVGWILSPR